MNFTEYKLKEDKFNKKFNDIKKLVTPEINLEELNITELKVSEDINHRKQLKKIKLFIHPDKINNRNISEEDKIFLYLCLQKINSEKLNFIDSLKLIKKNKNCFDLIVKTLNIDYIPDDEIVPEKNFKIDWHESLKIHINFFLSNLERKLIDTVNFKLKIIRENYIKFIQKYQKILENKLLINKYNCSMCLNQLIKRNIEIELQEKFRGAIGSDKILDYNQIVEVYIENERYSMECEDFRNDYILYREIVNLDNLEKIIKILNIKDVNFIWNYIKNNFFNMFIFLKDIKIFHYTFNFYSIYNNKNDVDKIIESL
uniref:Uncharacterized protein n=1 Tax=viral metagenome TaxID=1070528 RepID=A0A6C0AEP1_9ZZZZ